MSKLFSVNPIKCECAIERSLNRIIPLSAFRAQSWLYQWKTYRFSRVPPSHSQEGRGERESEAEWAAEPSCIALLSTQILRWREYINNQLIECCMP